MIDRNINIIDLNSGSIIKSINPELETDGYFHNITSDNKLLIKHGYQVYGCDVSSIAIKITIERIRNLNLKGKFEVSYFNSLPYENEFFDMIIAWHSIYYNSFETLLQTINEISRVLKKNGLFFSNYKIVYICIIR